MYTQKLKQETAHEMDLALSTFHNMLEPLEEYIGKTGYYPNWDSKRQLYRNTIKDSNDTIEGFEDLFLTQLLIVAGAIGKKPADFRKKVQEEYYKWVNVTGIDVDNCPEKLKHFLFEINEVLEGRGEKIFNQTKELVKDIKLDPKDMPGIFGATHGQLNRNSERKKVLKGQKWNELEDKSKFESGDDKKGKLAFGRISNTVASHHGDFHFYPQHPTNLDEMVQEVKNNPQNWKVDEIATEINNSGWAKKQEIAVYCRHARLDDYNREGKLNFNNNPIYRWENFSSQQRFEVKKTKNISGDYLTSEEIKWVVREVKENPRVWRVQVIKGQTYLIHNSAQIKDNEVGTLIHNQQKFNEAKWAEINGAFERAKLIDDIKQNAELEKELFVINQATGEYYKKDDWFIHNSLKRKYDNKSGYLIYVPSLMIRAKELSEAEQKEVGYKTETSHQVQTTDNYPQGGGGSGWGSPYVYGSLGIISLIGLAFTR